MRILAVAMASLVLGTACGGGPAVTATAPARPVPYASEVDGIALEHPPTWYRAQGPLATGLVGDDVEILGLTTTPPPPAVDPCSPYPWAAMKALGPDDAVMSLRMSTIPVSVGGLEMFRAGLRPTDLFGRTPAPAQLPGGCDVAGVAVFEWVFAENDRRYTAVIAATLPLGEDRRVALERIWASLELQPLPASTDTGAELGREYFHRLYTHCGIISATFDGRTWMADPPLDDGSGNPPAGWGNTAGVGVMELTAPDRARFTTRQSGATAEFRLLREGEPGPGLCA